MDPGIILTVSTGLRFKWKNLILIWKMFSSILEASSLLRRVCKLTWKWYILAWDPRIRNAPFRLASTCRPSTDRLPRGYGRCPWRCSDSTGARCRWTPESTPSLRHWVQRSFYRRVVSTAKPQQFVVSPGCPECGMSTHLLALGIPSRKEDPHQLRVILFRDAQLGHALAKFRPTSGNNGNQGAPIQCAPCICLSFSD